MKKSFLPSFVFAILVISAQIALGQTLNPHKKPAYQTAQEKAMRNPAKNESLFKTSLYKMVPKDIILPGEFEESQAVAISWAFDYDVNGNPSGLDLTSVYADVSAQLADYIQKECTIWIRVLKPTDTTLVKENMVSRKTPLTNYKFIIANGEDWWTRDYGPMAFYSKNLDSIGFVDMKYYDGRDNDNLFPGQMAQAMGYQNYLSQINAEGGNLMGDGFGKLFFSDVIPNVNADNTIHTGPWTPAQTFDTLKQIFNTPDLTNLVSLKCDGGTGHIDLYVKLLDEQTLIVSQYPSEITSKDRQIIEDNHQYLSSLTTAYGRPFRIFRVEHPTADNGTHVNRSCAQLDADARNFINGLTVNGSFIFPSYYDGLTGNATQHNRIMAFYKRIMPGYKIIPIDSRILSPLGGAIHCITMQIPVENPIRFWHPSLDGIVPALNKYHLIAKISNQSGIKEANCYWRKNNAATWNKVTMTDSSGYWIGDIDNAGMQGFDSLSYYISASSNNGKTSFKPLNAPNGGYYIMKLQNLSGVEDFLIPNLDHLFTAWPNPASNMVNIGFKLVQPDETEIKLFDINGKVVFYKNLGLTQGGMHQIELETSDLPAGLYTYQLVLGQTRILQKKLIINK